jgi:hypothetical protein
VFFGVTVKSEKVCHGLLFKVGVSKEIEEVPHLVLYEFNLLFVVSLGIHIELSSGRLENVGL